MSSQPSKSMPQGGRTILWLCVATLSLLAVPRLEAGSVFLKNGYIIQGPLVDKSDEAVVLGWDNGSVTIYQRFIESVTYDPGEEDKLKELARQREEEGFAAAAAMSEDSPAVEPDDLPDNVDVLLKAFAPEHTVPPPTTPTDGSDDSGTDGTPTVGVVAQPSAQLGERISSTGGFSLRPPQEWIVKESEGIFEAVGPAREDGSRPSLNMVRMEAGDLPFEDCIKILHAQQNEVLSDLETSTAGDRTLGIGITGHEVAGTGVLEGREMAFRQVLIPVENELWLFSGFSPDGSESESFQLVEESLKTLEFEQ